ncbi:glycosyltransferase family 4 protein [Sphingobium sp. JS3065]|uniref:glycosyltransferase family 4 protein n=1 Tax=Sphingobium sp. JS3065 TaxID=2970925 RepID=UPI0022644CB5|nr:glycosyltransferase family 4 protein [Sphingobium sp. JS3065]UZW55080.1 glycosyltransferase family 4 protein [Sphingobium sp. JS3065]
MRVLICSNAYPPYFLGGAELVAHAQAKALSRMGHEVRVFAGQLTSSRPRHDRADDVYEDVRVHRIAALPKDYNQAFLNFYHPAIDCHFNTIVQEFKPEIVHCHNLMGLSVNIPILAKRQGAKTICTLHDFWGFCLRNTAARPDGRSCDDRTQCRSCLPRIHDGTKRNVPIRFRKDFISFALEHVDQFIAPSRYLAARHVWAGFPADRLTVIPNGVDLERFHPALAVPDHENVRITYAGHFGAHKGVSTLLDALARIIPDMPSAMLQLAGEGPEYENYLARIEALGLHKHVQFLGKVNPSEMPDIYARSDIVVLPSVWDENQPVCLMEAMAAGLPVVASRKGGIPELIEHGENGLMFTAGDTFGLAAQLAKLIANSGLRQAAGCKGRQRVEALSHDWQIRRYLEIYAKPTAAPPASTRPREFYAAVGSMRWKMAGEDRRLADDMYPTRYFMPRKWLANNMPPSRGIILTGWLWSALHLLGVDAMFTLPLSWRRFSDAIRRHIAGLER